nr:DUF6049 family protein [Bifidobacterium choloepi]
MLVAVAMTLAIVVATVAGIAPAASANEPAVTSNDSSVSKAILDPDGNRTAVTQADDTTSSTGVTVSIEAITPVVTSTSGLTVTATIKNGTGSALGSGTFAAFANLSHTFVSRTDIQQWAEGSSNIPVPDSLGSVEVSPIADGDSATVTLTVPADNDVLKSLASWGPRPLALEYVADDGTTTVDYTFLTRSWDGLSGTKTPELNVAVAMPLTSDGWAANETAMDKLLTGKSTSATDPSGVVALTDDADNELKAKDKLADQYSSLNIVADPRVLADIGTPHIRGVMQPGDFDITAYAEIDDARLYESAGVTLQSWAAETGLNTYRAAIGDDSATSTAYAWQGDGIWTLDALAQAREQGYTTVIATHDFDQSDDSTVHTSTMVVPTSAGNVTVLVAQSVLSTLAGGEATSADADAETTSAGRVARFMAQSAFYQMEQPYTDRHLLVTMSDSTTASEAGELMAALRDADWLDLTDLAALADADPYASGDDASALVPSTTGDSSVRTSAIKAALESLKSSRTDISRFVDSVLVTGDGDSATAAAGGTGNGAGDGNGAGNGSDGASADGSSSSDDASSDSQARVSAASWGQYLLQAESATALLAMGGSAKRMETMVQAARQFADELMDAVSITSSNDVNVVSETASLPVTVSNSLPYPVNVKVSSITDSMEIVTSRFAETTVPAAGEAQVTFTIRVSTSGTTIATEQLLDRQDQAFGKSKTTTITSALQISDKSGVAFIVLAVVLGILGLWRQFHRKKDPDE